MKANLNKNVNVPIKLLLPPNSDEKLLLDIKYLNHLSVRFERFMSKTIMQCKNCQRFEHSASGCQHEHRCVKCGANHFRDKCPRFFDSSVKLCCCNCGGEHTANNLLNCPFFSDRYDIKTARDIPISRASTLNVLNKPKRASSKTVPGVSFAHTARASSGPSSNSDHLPSANINNISIETSTFIVDQLGKILAKLDDHLQLLNKHERQIK